MFFQEYSNKMIELHSKFLEFIEKEDDAEENYQNLENEIKNHNYDKDQHSLKTFLYLISKVSKNHSRTTNFFEKIEKVLLYLKKMITKHFTNLEIFNLFKSNRTIILFFIKEKIVIIDNLIINKINSAKLIQSKYLYLVPEIVEFINKEKAKESYENIIDEDYIFKYNEKIEKDFYKKREIGENDEYVCKLIREDLISEFISYVNKEVFPLKSTINPSFYETNSMLVKSKPSLIEYAAFYGSIQIFKYLFLNKIVLTPSLWIYGVHGDNPEIFRILEDNKIIPNDKTYREVLEEAIKCHHNYIAIYVKSNLLKEKKDNETIDKCILAYAFHYYNFAFFTKENFNHFIFYYACKYDYFSIVEFFHKTRKLYIKETI